MSHQEVIDKTSEFVKSKLANSEGGHDWWHILRVWNNSKHLAASEDVDLLTVELAALLHDIGDSKFHNGDEEIGPRMAAEFLRSLSLKKEVSDHVVQIIRCISFKGGNHAQEFFSPELAVVQDADRLDAMGAMGIARAFNYGGFKNRKLYDPEIHPNLQMNKEEYKLSNAPTINHFYEKLLLLKDRMHTASAKKMAEKRHKFMLLFLEQFYSEWSGEK